MLFLIVLVFVGIAIAVSLLGGETFISMLPLVLILLVTAVPVAMPAMFTVSMAKGSQQLADWMTTVLNDKDIITNPAKKL